MASSHFATKRQVSNCSRKQLIKNLSTSFITNANMEMMSSSTLSGNSLHFLFCLRWTKFNEEFFHDKKLLNIVIQLTRIIVCKDLTHKKCQKILIFGLMTFRFCHCYLNPRERYQFQSLNKSINSLEESYVESFINLTSTYFYT